MPSPLAAIGMCQSRELLGSLINFSPDVFQWRFMAAARQSRSFQFQPRKSTQAGCVLLTWERSGITVLEEFRTRSVAPPDRSPQTLFCTDLEMSPWLR